MLVSNLAMSEAEPEAVIVGKANCGIPVVKGKNTVYTGTPELMADFVSMAADAGRRNILRPCVSPLIIMRRVNAQRSRKSRHGLALSSPRRQIPRQRTGLKPALNVAAENKVETNKARDAF